jgi:hypothetical protein
MLPQAHLRRPRPTSHPWGQHPKVPWISLSALPGDSTVRNDTGHPGLIRDWFGRRLFQKAIWCQVRPASVVRSSHWPPLLTTTEPTVPLT